MGLAYVERLSSAGHEVLGYDVSPQAMSALDDAGGKKLGSLRELVVHSVPVFLSLPDAGVVEHVVADILDGLGDGTLPGIVDLSTSGPVGAEKIARTLSGKGLRYAEAPVTGGVSGARNGTLTLMTAGDRALVDEVEPVLRSLGTVVRVGDKPGLGQTMKVLNNLLSATNLVITSEALAAGAASGLDPAQMLEVFNAGSARNAATADKFPKYVLSGTFDQGFAAALMAKDVRLAQEFLHAVGMPAWVAAAVVETWVAACRQLPNDADFTEIARVHASYVFPGADTSDSIYQE